VLRAVATTIRIAVGLDVGIEPGALGDDGAYDAHRGQIDSRRILPRLEEFATEGTMVLGIADRDLFSTVFQWIFGEAHLGGHAAVVSTYRLQPEFSGAPPDLMLLQQRLSKECLHEIGHLFGLVHCENPGCVMRFAGTLAEIDSKTVDYCDSCLMEIARKRGSG
jgi:archaemetzincin